MIASLGLSAAAATLLGLAAAQSWATPSSPSFFSAASPSTSWAALGPVPSSPSSPAICGQGFTYCGYILRDHQNFKEEDIVKAYCAGSKENCANGKAKTDPIQALYVCLPPNAKQLQQHDDEPQQQQQQHQDQHGRRNVALHTVKVKGRRQAPTSPVNNVFPSTTGGVGGASNNNGPGNTCSSVATTGNTLQLLCSCGGQCLNPVEDHIGRCDAPCA
ncbi:hypothetical protein B0T17DRAFT_613052 [Bombardia bombarda]|uniref:Uncharacterized protein n=1 Tax=Bombardia bombarda TaxID=252184 RepID=A0AA39XLL7_9PEZI|nr:hypothetical protein B0T17DRAFT_613052 [Bombardia bombarda]